MLKSKRLSQNGDGSCGRNIEKASVEREKNPEREKSMLSLLFVLSISNKFY